VTGTHSPSPPPPKQAVKETEAKENREAARTGNRYDLCMALM
jgi:hypothetical protein